MWQKPEIWRVLDSKKAKNGNFGSTKKYSGWQYSKDILNFSVNFIMNILIKYILIKEKACIVKKSDFQAYLVLIFGEKVFI